VGEIPTPNVSLVAFYGSKPPPLAAFLQKLQQQLDRALEGQFRPSPLEQIHGTLIGCEGTRRDRAIVSHWWKQRRGETRHLDLSGFLHELHCGSAFPFDLRLGGYDSEIDYGFLSRDRHPFERSFQFRDNLAVLVGWLHQGDPDLDRFRRNAQHYNFLHKFHDRPDAIDNDFYLRIGTIIAPVSPERRSRIEAEIRHFLKSNQPVRVKLNLDDLAFVRYRDLTLSPDTTQVLNARDASVELLQAWYPAGD
jgi:hypothetical protein